LLRCGLTNFLPGMALYWELPNLYLLSSWDSMDMTHCARPHI
jgi:hypothetical protein